MLITAEAMNVVIISIAPWAKLTIRVARQISTSASATAAYTAPVEMPLSVRSMNLVTALRTRGRRGAGARRRRAACRLLLGDHLAEVQDHAAVGDRQGAAGVLLDQQHRQAERVGKLADERHDLGDEQRRQSQRRLVEQQRPRAGPSARDRSRASAARRRTASTPAACGARAAAGTARRSPRAAPPLRAAPQAAEAEVLLDGQLADHAAPLGHVGQAPPDDLLDRAAG